jgi:hypothetical protein
MPADIGARTDRGEQAAVGVDAPNRSRASPRADRGLPERDGTAGHQPVGARDTVEPARAGISFTNRAGT